MNSMTIVRISRFVITSVLICVPQFGCTNSAIGNAQQEKAQSAARIFDKLCGTAGEKIFKTVENVDGVFLVKLRPEKSHDSQQFSLDDPYGRDFSGHAYIKSFLAGFSESGTSGGAGARPVGYKFVEAIDPADMRMYRYTASLKAVRKKDITAPYVKAEIVKNPKYDINIYAFVLDKKSVESRSARFGVQYNDISTQEQREHWIAGSLLQIIDLDSNAVLAERTGYMMDPGQGATAGGRSPWLIAAGYACPGFGLNGQRSYGVPGAAGEQMQQSELFAEKVVKPTR